MIGCGRVFFDAAVAAAEGSRSAYLIVVPLLIAMIAYGCRTPPRGVGDAEADWILAGLIGGLGLFLRYLMSNRFPTLTGLWHLPLLGAVIWAALVATVLFGVRRVTQMWPVWVFAIVTVLPLPYLLVTARLGGTTAAASSLAALLGSVAVFLSGRLSPLRWRLIAAGGCAVFGVAMAAGLAERPLLFSILITAGVVPVLGFTLLQVFIPERVQQRHAHRAPLPHRSPWSLVALAAATAVVVVINESAVTVDVAPAKADTGWVSRLGLPAAQQFRFIHRYLGPDATFARYAAPSISGDPEAAVDIITAGSLAALRTFEDAIWYPAAVPPNYRAVDVGNPAVTGARAAATDAAAAADPGAQDWYAVTWLWQVGSAYQQLFVIVNQNWTSIAPPPGQGRCRCRRRWPLRRCGSRASRPIRPVKSTRSSWHAPGRSSPTSCGRGHRDVTEQMTPPVLAPHFSARHALGPQALVVLAALAVVVVAATAMYPAQVTPVFTMVFALQYLVSTFDRNLLLLKGIGSSALISVSEADALAVPDEELPTYTVLLPVYLEPEIVQNLLNGVGSLDYPRDKLEVLLLIEEDDTATQMALRGVPRDDFRVVIVPNSLPKTKPKACNYGMSVPGLRGEMITIYDAEDIPDPLQLRRAAVAFRRAPDDVGCLQARLGYFNERQNLLTRWFSLEYDQWFGAMLPAVEQARCVVPLGGTSSHLPARIWREVGGWDEHNVTEDADLGVRLARHGYRTLILDSITLEEANSDLINWIRQRSRWYKGYLQTLIVHMRRPVRLRHEIGRRPPSA